MTGLVDYGDRLTKTLATRDRVAAAVLIGEVQAALASGSASGPGFQDDLAKLAAIAGLTLTKAGTGRAEPMEKRAERPTLPPHLRAEAEAAIARIKGAGGRMEKSAAMAHGRAVQQRLQNYWAGLGAVEAIGRAHRAGKVVIR